MPSKRAAIVLAGGRSLRFGSNKALQTLGGKPLICHVIDRLASLDDIAVVIGRRERATKYRAVLPKRVRVINDYEEGKNPLIGVVSGLQSAVSDYVAVLACDAPFVNDAVIDFLFRCALDGDAAVPRWDGGRIEPLQAVYQRLPALSAAQEALGDKDASHREMINRLRRVVYVSVESEIRRIDPSLHTFFNINTREDLSIAKRILAEESYP